MSFVSGCFCCHHQQKSAKNFRRKIRCDRNGSSSLRPATAAGPTAARHRRRRDRLRRLLPSMPETKAGLSPSPAAAVLPPSSPLSSSYSASSPAFCRPPSTLAPAASQQSVNSSSNGGYAPAAIPPRHRQRLFSQKTVFALSFLLVILFSSCTGKLSVYITIFLIIHPRIYLSIYVPMNPST